MAAAIILGLAAALAYGATDFLARICGRRIGVLRTMLFGQLSAAVILSFVVATVAEPTPSESSSIALGAISALGATVLILAASAMLFQGLAHGTVSVVAPITATYGGVTAILSIATGEQLTVGSGAALAIILAGAAIVSIAPRSSKHSARTGVWWALGAALLFGIGFWVQGAFAAPRLGGATAVWIYYVIGTATLAAIALIRRTELLSCDFRFFGLAAIMGTMSAGGYLTLLAGFAIGHGAIVVVLSGLASAVTVLLCRILLKEPVSAVQWSGIAVLLLGLAGLRLL